MVQRRPAMVLPGYAIRWFEPERSICKEHLPGSERSITKEGALQAPSFGLAVSVARAYSSLLS